MSNAANQTFNQIFAEIMEQNQLAGYTVPPFANAFAGLFRCLGESKHNVTAIRDTAEVCAYHFADALTLAEVLPAKDDARLLDVGSGGGFPGLPLAIARPNWHITALDSTAKKLEFVRETALSLLLNNISTLSGRGEELARRAEYREKFDLVTARGVAHLVPLAELCLPFVKVGGIFAAMKGDSGESELAAAKDHIAKLGGEVADIHDYTLSCGEEKRQRKILLIHKISDTPPNYPRSWKAMTQEF